MSSRKKLFVCVSLDVEEEGLFGGHYERLKPQVKNIALLPQLAPISRTFGLPLTLFCAFSVFADIQAREVLDWMRENCKVEIGAHLHHWNTPPLAPEKDGAPERTHELPPDLLAARLDNLLAAARAYLGRPVRSFRMGRWDLKAPVLNLLAERGIKVDSSICPLRSFRGGANHFLAPANPFWRPTPSGPILVAPITQISVVSGFSTLWSKACGNRQAILDRFHFFGAMSANPFWHGGTVMRMAVRRHVADGGKILNLFWHSSELMPGGSPRIPDEAAAEKYKKKIFSFFAWLRAHYQVEGLTLGDLPGMDDIFHFPVLDFSPDRDW